MRVPPSDESAEIRIDVEDGEQTVVTRPKLAPSAPSGPRGRIQAPGKWIPHRPQGLDRLSKSSVLLLKRLSDLAVSPSGVLESLRARLKGLLEEEPAFKVDLVHVVPPSRLARYWTAPTFLAALAPSPHRSRAFLEVELELAQAAVDRLLGGTGAGGGHRPLTEIEEGVMSFLVLEMLKAISPALAPGLPKIRLDGVASTTTVAQTALDDEPQVVVVQLSTSLSGRRGCARLVLPASFVSWIPDSGGGRKERKVAALRLGAGWLPHLESHLAVEIGTAEIGISDVESLKRGDVVLLDQLTARTDKGELGTAKLKVGIGASGWIDAELLLQEGSYAAKVAGFSIGRSTRPPAAPPAGPADGSAVAGKQGLEEINPGGGVPGKGPNVSETGEGSELLTDIPLAISVELARVPITAEDVVGLQIGDVIELGKAAGEPVDLAVNGKVLAQGELVEIEGRLGVRVVSLSR